MFNLKNKTALVTGAGSGIGRAIALALADHEAQVVVTDREIEAGRETVALITKRGRSASFHRIDITDEAAVTDLAKQTPPIDVLVNNAGIGHVGDIARTGRADLERLLTVNVVGTFNVCKAFVPGMLERGAGSVIAIASIGGVLAVRERLAYNTSKHAVVGLMKSLALDHTHRGVRFNCVCPGRVQTPFVTQRIAESPNPEAARREMASTQLTGRMATPEEVAAAVIYLAADESAMVSGSCLMVDGGWSAGK